MANESGLIVQESEREKIQLIKDTVAKGATDLELKLFLHAARRTGLDPLMKQIYAVKRWSSRENRDVMTIQTGIDGYRLIADRTERYAGSDDPVFEVTENGKQPTKATVTVYKLIGNLKCAFSSSARWEEYVQRGRDGQAFEMWKRMPFLMLGKCAEALALRKAFPAELSGIYTTEEMMQADSAKPMIEETGKEDGAGNQPALGSGTSLPLQASDAPTSSHADADLNTIHHDLLAEAVKAISIDACNLVLSQANQYDFSATQMQFINMAVSRRMRELKKH